MNKGIIKASISTQSGKSLCRKLGLIFLTMQEQEKVYPYQNLSLEDMDGEVWKDISGYEGYYQVSNLGNVRSLNYNRTGSEMILRLGLTKGYYSVGLWQDGIMKRKSVHRLVAQAFIPNPENKREIDHIDTIKTNNYVKNLQWATRKENGNNPITKRKISISKTGRSGVLNNRSIPIIQYSKTGEFIAEFAGARQAARITKITQQSISKVCKGKRLSAGGYVWKYKNETTD